MIGQPWEFLLDHVCEFCGTRSTVRRRRSGAEHWFYACQHCGTDWLADAGHARQRYRPDPDDARAVSDNWMAKIRAREAELADSLKSRIAGEVGLLRLRLVERVLDGELDDAVIVELKPKRGPT